MKLEFAQYCLWVATAAVTMAVHLRAGHVGLGVAWGGFLIFNAIFFGMFLARSL